MSGHRLPPPHGGRLVSCLVGDEERTDEAARARELPAVRVDAATAAELELIAVGAYSPLTGFMTRDEYEAVLTELHLPDGLPWTLPVLLRVDPASAEVARPDRELAVWGPGETLLGTLRVADVFRVDKGREARLVYGTDDPAHPGVHALYRAGTVAIGGPVRLLQRPPHPLRPLILDPPQVRRALAERGFTTVVAFQTRNPLHRAHEYLLKCALELVDGVLLHPLVGPTKADDLPAWVRMRAYEALLAGYFPRERVVLAGFPAPMRYGGPREAVFHAIVRKNYGATHFIVGRDHAGVGRFYGPYDAQRIFARFDPRRLGITPLFFEAAFYCRRCGGMATAKTCPHDEEVRVLTSGTYLRQLLASGQLPPPECMRPEVAEVLRQAMAAGSRAG